jgi:hypothetical protein
MSSRGRRNFQSAAGLSPIWRLAVYGTAIGVWLTGGLWLLFHYFIQAHGEFGASPHPLEPWWLELHGAFAFAAVWLFGLLWGLHVTKGWSLRSRRRSGSTLVAVLIWFTVSGYLLYYAGDDELRATVSVLHWVVGLAAPLALVAHRYRSWRERWLARSLNGVPGDSHVAPLPRRHAGRTADGRGPAGRRTEPLV